MQDRKYTFTWDLLGDIVLGRPNLGPLMRLDIYRLMQFTFRDVVEQQFGTAKADELFHQAGALAGRAFYNQLLPDVTEFSEFVRRLQEAFLEMRMGILRFEESDLEGGRFVLTLEEDLDCSGLPELDFETCKYDEGFLGGVLGAFTGQTYRVTEVDCWCTGDRTCRFVAEVEPAHEPTVQGNR